MHEIVIKGGDGTTVRGRWWTRDDIVTVVSSHGQQMTTELRGSTPQGLARLLLLLMEEERRGPVPPTPEEIEEAKKASERAIAETKFNRMADYAIRGRRFGGLSDTKLLRVWTAAYDKMEDGPADDVAQEALTFDLDAEFEIRGIESPYREYSERRWAERAKNQREQLRKD
jgi:hypothetical protein